MDGAREGRGEGLGLYGRKTLLYKTCLFDSLGDPERQI